MYYEVNKGLVPYPLLVTKVMSGTTAEVDGVSRRVADLRLCHQAAGGADVADVEVVGCCRCGGSGMLPMWR